VQINKIDIPVGRNNIDEIFVYFKNIQCRTNNSQKN
jgi:hypothetical protein